MNAIKTLPPSYKHLKTLNLSGKSAVIGLNLAAIPLLFIFGWLFERLTVYLRTNNPFPIGILRFLITFSGWKVIALPLSIVIMVILHELIHGIFFWIYTRERPRFALKGGYAFAAAPGWYLPRNQYINVGLSPLIAITVIAIFLAVFVAQPVVPYMLIIASFNAAGALGDMIVVAWVLRLPETTLVKDDGDTFSAYVPENIL
jgi:Putative zincin peptidase